MDRRIVEDLSNEQPDYVAFVASRLGMPLKYVERRCDALVRSKLLERTDGNVKYRLTERGERCLEEGFEAVGVGKTEE